MKSKHKRLTLILLSVLALILILIGVFLGRINAILENYTRSKLESLLEKESERLYDIRYDSLIVDVYGGDVKVINFSIIPRKEVLDSLYRNRIPRKYVIDFKLGDFILEDLRILKFIRTGKIELEGLQFNNIEGKLYLNDTVKIRHKSNSVGDDILSGQFVSALLHAFEINDGSVQWFKTSGDTTEMLSFDHFNLHIHELYSDSSLIKEALGANLANLEVSLENFNTKLVKDYQLESEKISFNSEENRLSVIHATMIPSENKVGSRNYFELKVGQIDLVGLDYDSLILSDMYLIRKLFIADPEFTYIRPPQKLQKDTLRFLPAVTFKKIPFALLIDTLELRNGYFNYLKHGHGEPLLYFDMSNIHIEGYHFTSEPNLMPESKTFLIGGSLKFFKSTPVRMQFTFPMTDRYNGYTIDGEIDTLQGTHLNQIIKNPFKMQVVSGTFNKMTFSIHGNDTLAQGNFEGDYSNLKIEALVINENDFTDSKRQGFKTFLVNTLARKKNDPAKSSFTEGIIYLDRDDHWTFLDFNLNALLNGLVTSVIPESKSFIVPKEKRQEIREEQKEKR